MRKLIARGILTTIAAICCFALWVIPADAGTTITLTQPGKCNMAMTMSSTTSATISAGDCSWPFLGQGSSGTGTTCMQYPYCGYSSGSWVSSYEVVGNWEFSSTLWLSWTINVINVSSFSATQGALMAGAGSTGHTFCLFNGADIQIPAETITAANQSFVMTSATSAMLGSSSPSTISGSAGVGCTQPTSSQEMVLGVSLSSSVSGPTGKLNWQSTPTNVDYAGVGYFNGECFYGGQPSTPNCPHATDNLMLMSLVNSASSLSAAPCTLGSITGDTSLAPQVSGVNHAYTYYEANADAIILIDPLDTTATTRTVYGKTFPTDASFDIGPGLSDTETIDFVAYGTDPVNPDAWCYNQSTNFWYDWGPLSGQQGFGLQPGTPPPSGGTTGDCYANAGWTLTDPVSWVTGALHDGVCLLQALFQPSFCSGSVTQCVNYQPLVTTFDNAIPTAYLVDAKNAITTFITAVNTSVGVGSCSPPSVDMLNGATSGYLHTLDGGHPLVITMPKPGDACGSSTVEDVRFGEIFGARVYLRDFFAIGMILAFLALLWRMMPWSKPGDGIEFFEVTHVDEFERGVQVFQTKEGSDD